jgi:hypothetical protein
MTVKELISSLRKHSPDRIVIIQKSSGEYSPLDGVFTAAYLAEEIGIEELTPFHFQKGFTEADVLTGGSPALVLAPVR